MAMAALIGFLFGAVVGMRLRALVLIPAGVLGMAIAFAVALMRTSVGFAVAAALAYVFALQFGYLACLFVLHYRSPRTANANDHIANNGDVAGPPMPDIEVSLE